MNKLKDTEKSYGFLWKRGKKKSDLPAWHFTYMQEAVNEPIVRGSRGIEAGSGCGYDTYIMAKDNPDVDIVSIDLSDGVYEAKELTSGFKNVDIIKCSVLDMPFKNEIFDFAYSFGVLHHTINPEKALSEIVRVLKRKSPVFLYLYEDHSENFFKYTVLKAVSAARIITIKIPHKPLYALCCLGSPLIFCMFTVPAKILRLFKPTQRIAGRIPFNFGSGPFSLRGDLYDRFSAPLEYRFSKDGVHDLLTRCGLCDINITRIKDIAGWVSWGFKK